MVECKTCQSTFHLWKPDFSLMRQTATFLLFVIKLCTLSNIYWQQSKRAQRTPRRYGVKCSVLVLCGLLSTKDRVSALFILHSHKTAFNISAVRSKTDYLASMGRQITFQRVLSEPSQFVSIGSASWGPVDGHLYTTYQSPILPMLHFSS